MEKSKILKELSQHYEMWTQDNEKRTTRVNGWNDITDAYYGKLPDDWPYETKITDPRIRTTLIEKNARLINSKLRGSLSPREGGDMVGAAINNAILEFQWDNANESGSMLTKIGICDMDARLYQSKFVLVKWRYEADGDEVLFDGNDIVPLDIRDCGLDPTCTHIKDAKWFQHRTWEHMEDLEAQVDTNGKPIFKNLDKLKNGISEKLGQKHSASRSKEYTSRVKQLRGLEDRTGEDMAFPVVMIVTEYRTDRWVTYAPDYGLILRDIANPYKHGQIPVAQLRYYPLQDDPLGESEVECVIPLWKAIQAVVCSYMDEVILKMRPPLKIIENAARIETILYGPEAQWLVDRPDAVTEMTSGSGSLQYFQTTYQALVAAFNIAMGDLSQGTSSVDPFSTDNKTATEIRASVRQQNMRDQKNQNDLGEFLKDIMMMWLSNNQQFLFADPEKTEHIIKIVGKDKYDQYKQMGLDESEVPPEAMEMITDIVDRNPDISDVELSTLYETASIPKYPVVLNPNEKDPTKLKIKKKLIISDVGNMADLAATPGDLVGTYDYIPDVRSMATGASEELIKARQQAMMFLTSNANVLQLLAGQGWVPNTKQLLVDSFEDTGLKGAERYFTKINGQPLNQTQGNPQQMGGPLQAGQAGGLPQPPQANLNGGIQQQMAGPVTG